MQKNVFNSASRSLISQRFNLCCDMATKIDAARLLTYRAAALYQQGQKVTKQAAMAKLFASEAANHAAYKAMQISGGYGVT